MSNYVSITRIMNAAYGVAARIIGVPMDLYRLSNVSNGDYVQPQNYVLTLPCDREPMKRGDPGFESSNRTDVFWFDVMLNGNVVQLGDVLILNDPYYGKNYVIANPNDQQFIGLCMVAESPVKNYLAARLDIFAQFYRPLDTPNTDGYWDATLPQEVPIILQNGVLSLGSVGETASYIPIGSMPFRNRGEVFDVKTPNLPQKEQRFLFVPPLPGLAILPGDKMVSSPGARYVIQSNYYQGVGTVGGQFLAEKLISGGPS